MNWTIVDLAKLQVFDDPTVYNSEDLLRDHASFVQSQSLADAAKAPGSNGLPHPSQQARVADLESEVQHLRGQLAKAKGINDAMWEEVVRKRISDRGDAASNSESIEYAR